MPDAAFKKLFVHIKRTGNYEPVVVRKHPDQDGRFQIINGHHRVKALQQLQAESVDCVIWDIDDDEAGILLLTLNRLQGRDDVLKKSELIKKLSRRFDIKELSKQLSQSRKSIEHLKHLDTSITKIAAVVPQFLIPLVFYFDDQQKHLVERAIAVQTAEYNEGTGAQKKAKAVVAICEKYLQASKGA